MPSLPGRSGGDGTPVSPGPFQRTPRSPRSSGYLEAHRRRLHNLHREVGRVQNEMARGSRCDKASLDAYIDKVNAQINDLDLELQLVADSCVNQLTPPPVGPVAQIALQNAQMVIANSPLQTVRSLGSAKIGIGVASMPQTPMMEPRDARQALCSASVSTPVSTSASFGMHPRSLQTAKSIGNARIPGTPQTPMMEPIDARQVLGSASVSTPMSRCRSLGMHPSHYPDHSLRVGSPRECSPRQIPRVVDVGSMRFSSPRGVSPPPIASRSRPGCFSTPQPVLDPFWCTRQSPTLQRCDSQPYCPTPTTPIYPVALGPPQAHVQSSPAWDTYLRATRPSDKIPFGQLLVGSSCTMGTRVLPQTVSSDPLVPNTAFLSANPVNTSKIGLPETYLVPEIAQAAFVPEQSNGDDNAIHGQRWPALVTTDSPCRNNLHCTSDLQSMAPIDESGDRTLSEDAVKLQQKLALLRDSDRRVI